jgi:hypothetical protein
MLILNLKAVLRSYYGIDQNIGFDVDIGRI